MVNVVVSHSPRVRPTVSAVAARRVVRAAARFARIRFGYCEIVFTTDRMMRQLNKRHRRINRPTDVLTFPGSQRAKAPQYFLGEIYLNVDDVRRRKKAEQIPPHCLTTFLLVHGFLHCAGFDHDTPTRLRSMRKAERAVCKNNVYYDHQ